MRQLQAAIPTSVSLKTKSGMVANSKNFCNTCPGRTTRNPVNRVSSTTTSRKYTEKKSKVLNEITPCIVTEE